MNTTGKLLEFLETHQVIKGSIFNFCLLSLYVCVCAGICIYVHCAYI